MINNLLEAAEFVFTLNVLLALAIGIIVGYFVGALPGLSSSMGMALLIPFTFGMDPIPAIVMLVAIYMASDYGGVIPAILVNAPGEPSSAVSAMDGFAMSQAGEAGKALTLSIMASGSGALISTIFLIATASVMADYALAFGPSEFFALSVVGLALISILGAGTPLKSLIGLLLGLCVVTIGLDPIGGTDRYVFTMYLIDGVPFVAALIGLFAISEVFVMIEEAHGPRPKIVKLNVASGAISTILPHWFVVLRSTILGYMVGLIPGAGASIASLVSYAVARKSSRTPEAFGTGSEEGLVASEAANNAARSGAMAPLLSLGVPASASAAVLVGGMTIQGLQPGPLLFTNNPEIPYAIFVSLLVSLPIMVLIGLFSAPFWVRVTSVPRAAIATVVVSICMLGAYSAANDTFEMIVAAIFGIVGYILRKCGIHPAPIVLALVLGELMETSLRRAMIISYDNFLQVISHPIAAGLLVVAVVVLISPLIKRRSRPA